MSGGTEDVSSLEDGGSRVHQTQSHALLLLFDPEIRLPPIFTCDEWSLQKINKYKINKIDRETSVDSDIIQV